MVPRRLERARIVRAAPARAPARAPAEAFAVALAAQISVDVAVVVALAETLEVGGASGEKAWYPRHMATDRTLPALIGGGLLAYFLLRSKGKAAEPTPTPPKVDDAAYRAGFERGGIDGASSINKANKNIGTAVSAVTSVGPSDKGTDKGRGYQDGFVKSVKLYAPYGFRIEGTSDDLFSSSARVIRDKLTTYESGLFDGESDAAEAMSSFDFDKGEGSASIPSFRADMAKTEAERGYKEGYADVLVKNDPPLGIVGDLVTGSAILRIAKAI